eukprot:TRINITY_DN5854_c0_g1_i1.p1 TRINITY_DN5854_c0_g1~~TRINITY_DN5854_c0_g1_i1.p1  ORF type:complete len:429 (-),score=96.60 TRINITY_DN5854_c0_g1_i1:1301-2587(-)
MLLQYFQKLWMRISISLSTLLIERCCRSFPLANNLYWFVSVTTHDPKYGANFKDFQNDFLQVLKISKPDGLWVETLTIHQPRLIQRLQEISEKVRPLGYDARKAFIKNTKIAEVKELCELDPPIASPLHPSLLIHGIVPENSTVFTSAMAPLRLTLKVSEQEKKDNREIQVIFKSGDDLRKDQLIMQLFGLMDNLWKRHSLDLRMSLYSVLPISPTAGFVEPVGQALDVSEVLAKNNDNIGDFLTSQSLKKNQQQEILTNYVRSCAGYCVATYILAIGDRHLENIMLRKTGHLFHIDFGYIFGKDPKIKGLLTKVRLTKQMLDAMGGFNSSHCNQFFMFSFEAYNILRANAKLLLNLLTLMKCSQISELRDEFDKTIKIVEERLRLDLEDPDEASVHLAQVLVESALAIGPEFLDWAHKMVISYKTRT